ncbi:hypothetical protein KVT40_002472 [Elsinoe batatas]|uniref:Helicase ATP-binding domain-containing protein n=1 Tax=Elsinoe batatas TaxID=2601811 RepID=A0A8K0PKQ3_9PEZI|nr:hypothetical protein KVT40_002472 [Elsinoe batatas]
MDQQTTRPSKVFDHVTWLLKTGRLSDLTLRCQNREFLVHRAIVCPRSPVLAAASEGAFKESHTKIVDVSITGPDILNRALTYLYTDNYSDNENGQNDRAESIMYHALCAEQNATLASEISQPPRDAPESFAQGTPPGTVRSRVPTSSPSLLASPDVEALSHSGESQERDDPAIDNDNQTISRLRVNTLVYTLADYYNIPDLAQLASTKFEAALNYGYQEICRLVYESAPLPASVLRSCLCNVIARDGRKAIKDEAMMNTAIELPGLLRDCFVKLVTTNQRLSEERDEAVALKLIAEEVAKEANRRGQQEKENVISQVNGARNCRHCGVANNVLFQLEDSRFGRQTSGGNRRGERGGRFRGGGDLIRAVDLTPMVGLTERLQQEVHEARAREVQLQLQLQLLQKQGSRPLPTATVADRQIGLGLIAPPITSDPVCGTNEEGNNTSIAGPMTAEVPVITEEDESLLAEMGSDHHVEDSPVVQREWRRTVQAQRRLVGRARWDEEEKRRAVRQALGRPLNDSGSPVTYRSREQEMALNRIMDGGFQALAVMLPTASGKTLLFSAPACLEGDAFGMTLVVVPYHKLINETVMECRRRLGEGEYVEWSTDVTDAARLVIVSVDKMNMTFWAYMQKLRAAQRLRRIVVDECHLVVTAHDWRPVMVKLIEMKTFAVPLMSLTATYPLEEESLGKFGLVSVPQ